MEKLNIGIVTLHHGTNYGANLQAFALTNYICKIGYNGYLIDYYNRKRKFSGSLFGWLSISWKNATHYSLFKKIKLFIALLLSIPWKFLRLKRFHNFRRKNCNLSQYCSSEYDILKLKFDAIICGSDQIWNPEITGDFESVFWGQFCSNTKKIIYAASIGKEKFNKDEEELIQNWLSSINYISLRENQSSEYIGKLLQRNIQCVCDPVFLLEEEDYNRILPKNNNFFKFDYVLIYSVIHNEYLLKSAKLYAQEHNLKIVEISCSEKSDGVYKQIKTLGPEYFLYAIKHAKCIFTNSFHGLAFSIIFKRPFYVFDNINRGSRIINLIKKLKLDSQLVNSEKLFPIPIIDYIKTYQFLKEYKEKSKEFLNNAIKSEYKPVINENECIGCGICEKICPQKAIRLLENEKGFKLAYINLEKCINCNICHKKCIVSYTSPSSKPINIYAYKGRDLFRKNSSSGAAVAELANIIISMNGVVYGATILKNIAISHCSINNVNEIIKIQGSKYVQSDIRLIFDDICEKLLNKKIVLFSGTPCQVDAIKYYLKLKNQDDSHLITIDLICHGVPSPGIYRQFINFLENKFKSKIKTFNFRNKNISWRGNSNYVEFDNGIEFINNNYCSSFLNFYYSGVITRQCCYKCKYAKQERISDITVGDFWGIENEKTEFEDNLGVSLLIANTNKGKMLIRDLPGELIKCQLSNCRQPQLHHPPKMPTNYNTFWKEYITYDFEKILIEYGGIRKRNMRNILITLKNKLH